MRPIGINIFSFLTSQNSVGESARKLTKALDEAAIPYVCNTLPIVDNKEYKGLVTNLSDDSPYLVNIVCLNTMMIPVIIHHYGHDVFSDRYTIGICCWESENFPHPGPLSDYFNEIWTISEFCEKSISRVLNQVTGIVKFPIIPLTTHRLPEYQGKFVVLFMYDYGSTFQRKNPLLAITVFREAFGNDDSALLILKSSRAEFFEGVKEVMEAIGDSANIVHLNSNLSEEEKWRLFESCDVYLSLHSSEGLGFTPLEAMSIGKPVIATGYSGNMDYMTETNSIIVPYQIVDIPDGTPWYSGQGKWALPDVHYAATKLKELRHNPNLRQTLGNEARKYVEANYSVSTCSKLLKSLFIDALNRIDRNRYECFKALYGVDGNFIDVTPKVSELIKDSTLVISGVYNDMFGDHLPNVPKILRIVHPSIIGVLDLPENKQCSIQL